MAQASAARAAADLSSVAVGSEALVEAADLAVLEAAVAAAAAEDHPVAGKILGLEEAVLSAIRNAENNTSGEIRVHLSRNAFAGDPMREAKRIFANLKMDQTELRNGVLLYVHLHQQKFAFYGDRAIHEKVGQDFWDTLAATFLKEIKGHGIVRALTQAVAQVGQELGEHFPRSDSDKNELEDTVTTD